jgi:regulator of protease activity HflC (stomatin/prohibitin superfamily)
MIREREYAAMSGWSALGILLVAAGLSLWQMVENIKVENVGLIVVCALGVTFFLLMLIGLFMVNPNEGKVLQLFGRYVGTVKEPGLRYANPLYHKKKISIGVRSF